MNIVVYLHYTPHIKCQTSLWDVLEQFIYNLQYGGRAVCKHSPPLRTQLYFILLYHLFLFLAGFERNNGKIPPKFMIKEEMK